MSTQSIPTTAEAIQDRSARTNRTTTPLTDLQVDLIEGTAARLGWSKATLVREAVFRFTAAIEANRALSDPSSPLASFVPVDELSRR
jgi:hypothetical protein